MTTAAVACRAGCRRLAVSSLSRLGVQATVAAPRAGATADAASTVKVIGRAGISPACANGYWQPLYDATLARPLARVHSVVDGEVTADHVGTGSGSVLRQFVRLILDIIGAILPVVHADSAAVAVTGSVCLEKRVWPVTAVAEACKVHDVEHGGRALSTCRGHDNWCKQGRLDAIS